MRWKSKAKEEHQKLASDSSSAFDKAKSVVAIVAFFVLFYFVFTNAWIVKGLASGYGLFGLFIASVIANATVFLPLPIDLLILLSAESLGIWEVSKVALVLGAGAAVGEMTAYITGRLGADAIKSFGVKGFDKIAAIRGRIGESGTAFIFIGALVPFPFDLIGVTAGLIRYDWRKFFIAALFGKTLRYFIIGAAGYFGFAAVKGLFGI